MFEKLEKCPLCQSEKFSNFIICKDHLLTGESFAITKCNDCSFLFTNPRPLAENISRYYQSKEYISHADKATNLTNAVYKIARHFTLKQKVSLINTLSDQKTILDYGCGTGDFLLTCKKKGWIINGLEPDDIARNKAISKTDENIYAKIEQLNDAKKVSVITLWHVLEHIPDLNYTMNMLKRKLDTKGKMLIAVPNIKSLDAQLYKENWAAYDVPRHLYHFSMQTMKLLLKNHGLKIHNILPMKLDSFYVSLLSEKYTNGKSNFVKSFVNGYKSNIYAKKNNNNYSSVIYIAGK